jgi:hypothetical protein
MSRCCNICTLHVHTNETCNIWREKSFSQLISLLGGLIVARPILRKLLFDVPSTMARQTKEGLRKFVTLVHPALQINRHVGLQHEWTLLRSKALITLKWEAKGGTITWTNADYCRSVPWRAFILLGVHTRSVLFHGIIIISHRYLHTIGLNPRSAFYGCRVDPCFCEHHTAADSSNALYHGKLYCPVYKQEYCVLRNVPQRILRRLHYQNRPTRFVRHVKWSAQLRSL